MPYKDSQSKILPAQSMSEQCAPVAKKEEQIANRQLKPFVIRHYIPFLSHTKNNEFPPKKPKKAISLTFNDSRFVYLENVLIQEPGTEHSDAVGVDGGMVAPGKRLGDLLFTVHNDGDILLLHTDSNAVPPCKD